jgi:histidine triad (HIT) family protein
MSCIFCKIINKEIPSTVVYQDENVIAFKDLNPQAKEHILFIHKKHTKNLNEMFVDDPNTLLAIFNAINSYTQKSNLLTTGYRVVTNIGSQAGQSVFHTHFHLLAGETLGTFGS